ncbi:hypothetical protein C8J57DRAFT_1221724 [Mycena rebaudengoi]|nr:hypothetical protein C8J57DRAFT_1221724 [Mycena rebaudengoi]
MLTLMASGLTLPLDASFDFDAWCQTPDDIAAPTAMILSVVKTIAYQLALADRMLANNTDVGPALKPPYVYPEVENELMSADSAFAAKNLIKETLILDKLDFPMHIDMPTRMAELCTTTVFFYMEHCYPFDAASAFLLTPRARAVLSTSLIHVANVPFLLTPRAWAALSTSRIHVANVLFLLTPRAWAVLSTSRIHVANVLFAHAAGVGRPVHVTDPRRERAFLLTPRAWAVLSTSRIHVANVLFLLMPQAWAVLSTSRIHVANVLSCSRRRHGPSYPRHGSTSRTCFLAHAAGVGRPVHVTDPRRERAFCSRRGRELSCPRHGSTSRTSFFAHAAGVGSPMFHVATTTLTLKNARNGLTERYDNTSISKTIDYELALTGDSLAANTDMGLVIKALYAYTPSVNAISEDVPKNHLSLLGVLPSTARIPLLSNTS